MTHLINQIFSDSTTDVDADSICTCGCCKWSTIDFYRRFLIDHEEMDPREAVSALGPEEETLKKGRRVLAVFHRALLHHSGSTPIRHDTGDARNIPELCIRVGETFRIVSTLYFCLEQRYMWASLVGKVLSSKVDGPI